MSNRRVLTALGTFAALVLVATASSAANTFRFTGKFGSSRGAFIDIPVVGNVNCDEIKLDFRLTSAANPPVATPGGTQLNVKANRFGCVPHKGTTAMGGVLVSTTGVGAGGKFTIPVNFFTQPFPGATNAVPVPVNPNVVQLASSFDFHVPAGPGPGLPGATAGMVGMTSAAPNGTMAFPRTMYPTNLAAPRVFKQNAWASQTGRVGSMFTWCVDAPACVNIAGAPRSLIVKYTPGVNKFGGTMGHVLSTGSNLSSVGIIGLPALPPNAIGFLNLAGMGQQATGRGYADFLTDMIAVGDVWTMYTLTTASPTASVGENIVGMVSGFHIPGGLPADTNNGFGFPFTTGTVVARNSGTQGGQPVNLTLTARGTDTEMTNMGVVTARNISLVAGALAWTNILGAETAGIANMRLVPEPGAAAQLLAGAIGLLCLGAWRARVRR